MISNVLDWCFDEWFYENWENKGMKVGKNQSQPQKK